MKRLVILTCAGAIALGVLAGCGSDSSDDDSGSAATGSGVTATTGATGSTTGSDGTTGNGGGEVTPGKDAPDSAGDKDPNAPDDVITDKPGGSAKPAKP